MGRRERARFCCGMEEEGREEEEALRMTIVMRRRELGVERPQFLAGRAKRQRLERAWQLRERQGLTNDACALRR